MPRPVAAIVPAYEAADLVGSTVRELAATGRIDRIVVVDDASTDGTAAAAAAAGAEVVRHERNLGKGAALSTGVGHAPDAGRYLLVDADLAATAAGVVALLDHVDDGTVAIAIPVAAAGRGGFGLVRDLAANGIERACGVRPAAPLSGQRAVPGPVLRGLELAPRFAVETAMTIDLVRRGIDVVEVEVPVDHRHHGRSLAGVRHRAGQGVDVVRALLPRLGARGTLAVLGRTLVGRVRPARRTGR